MYKTVSTLSKEFKFELADDKEQEDAAAGLYRGKLPSMISVGISDLEAPLMVKASIRSGRGGT